MGRWSGWKIAALLCLSFRSTSTSSARFITPCSHLPETKKEDNRQLEILVPADRCFRASLT